MKKIMIYILWAAMVVVWVCFAAGFKCYLYLRFKLIGETVVKWNIGNIYLIYDKWKIEVR